MPSKSRSDLHRLRRWEPSVSFMWDCSTSMKKSFTAINTKDGEFYTHLHMSAADAEARVFGGHLVDATISATCEMVIRILDGCVDRKFSDEVGLNLFEF